MKLIRGCLLAVVVFGCLANAQTINKLQKPYQQLKPSLQEIQRPHPPPKVPETQRPHPPQKIPEIQRPPPPQKVPGIQKPQPPPKPQETKRPNPPQKPTVKEPLVPQPPEFHTCEVETNDRVQCGVPDIGALECDAINCCYDGRMCYYGKHGKYLFSTL